MLTLFAGSRSIRITDARPWMVQPVLYSLGCSTLAVVSVATMYCKYYNVLCFMSLRSMLWMSHKSTRFVVGRECLRVVCCE